MHVKLASALYEDLFSRRIRISTEESDPYKCSIYYHGLDKNGNVSHSEFSKIASVTILRMKDKTKSPREAKLMYKVFEPTIFERVMTRQVSQKIYILFCEIYHLDIVEEEYEVVEGFLDNDELEPDLDQLMSSIFKILELGVPIEVINSLLEDAPISVIRPDISIEEFEAMTDDEKKEYVESQIIKFRGDEDDEE